MYSLHSVFSAPSPPPTPKTEIHSLWECSHSLWSRRMGSGCPPLSRAMSWLLGNGRAINKVHSLSGQLKPQTLEAANERVTPDGAALKLLCVPTKNFRGGSGGRTRGDWNGSGAYKSTSPPCAKPVRNPVTKNVYKGATYSQSRVFQDIAQKLSPILSPTAPTLHTICTRPFHSLKAKITSGKPYLSSLSTYPTITTTIYINNK